MPKTARETGTKRTDKDEKKDRNKHREKRVDSKERQTEMDVETDTYPQIQQMQIECLFQIHSIVVLYTFFF